MPQEATGTTPTENVKKFLRLPRELQKLPDPLLTRCALTRENSKIASYLDSGNVKKFLRLPCELQKLHDPIPARPLTTTPF